MPPQRIWDKRTCTSAGLSIVAAVAITLSVSAFRGQLDTTPQPTSNSVSQSPTTGSTATCQKG
jgi:hypothetical protein